MVIGQRESSRAAALTSSVLPAFQSSGEGFSMCQRGWYVFILTSYELKIVFKDYLFMYVFDRERKRKHEQGEG